MKLGGKVAGRVRRTPDQEWLRKIYLNRVVEAIEFEIPMHQNDQVQLRTSLDFRRFRLK